MTDFAAALKMEIESKDRNRAIEGESFNYNMPTCNMALV